jgi:hypothetical protein
MLLYDGYFYGHNSMLLQQESVTILALYPESLGIIASLDTYCSGPVCAQSLARGDNLGDMALKYARRNADPGTARHRELLQFARAALDLGGVLITAVGCRMELNLAEQRWLEFQGPQSYNVETT